VILLGAERQNQYLKQTSGLTQRRKSSVLHCPDAAAWARAQVLLAELMQPAD
jgi:hypothetical protein